MSIEWTTSGLDLHLELRSGRRAGLAEALRAAVRSGRLAPGTRMPATRALAADLGLARGTVTSAYAELIAEGYLVARHGSGTEVATLPDIPPQPVPRAESAPPHLRWNLRPGRPDLSAFPRARWLAAARRALTAASADDLDYGDPRGHPRLRAALAGYLGRVRGVLASPEQIMICSGHSQGLVLLGTVLCELGVTAMAFENPSLPEFSRGVRTTGLSTPPVGVDDHGLRVAELAELNPGAVVVTPAHQYPLGHTLHPRRRAELIEFAHKSRALVIEDDYDGEFRFDRQPVGAIQAMAPDRVVYAGTTSKTLAPGLRLSWLVLPNWLDRPMRRARWAAGRHTAVLDQLTLAEFIESGDYDQHVRRCRTRYRARRDKLLAALAEHPELAQPAGIAAGLNMVLPLPAGRTEAGVLAAARAESLDVEALGRNWMTEGPNPTGLVVGYAAPAEHAFGPAVRALMAALTR